MGIVQSDEQIAALIREAAVNEIKGKFRKAAKTMEPRVQALFQRSLQATSTYKELLTGAGLRAEFGLKGATNKLAAIVDKWVKSISVYTGRISLNKNITEGVIIIRGIQGDWQDVLSLPQAKQITENGTDLKWLEWLLKRGNEVIIQDWHIEEGRGRGGPKVMARGGSWSVPAEHSGTTDNNWITRVIAGMEKQLEAVLLQALRETFNA